MPVPPVWHLQKSFRVILKFAGGTGSDRWESNYRFRYIGLFRLQSNPSPLPSIQQGCSDQSKSLNLPDVSFLPPPRPFFVEAQCFCLHILYKLWVFETVIIGSDCQSRMCRVIAKNFVSFLGLHFFSTVEFHFNLSVRNLAAVTAFSAYPPYSIHNFNLYFQEPTVVLWVCSTGCVTTSLCNSCSFLPLAFRIEQSEPAFCLRLLRLDKSLTFRWLIWSAWWPSIENCRFFLLRMILVYYSSFCGSVWRPLISKSREFDMIALQFSINCALRR